MTPRSPIENLLWNTLGRRCEVKKKMLQGMICFVLELLDLNIRQLVIKVGLYIRQLVIKVGLYIRQ